LVGNDDLEMTVPTSLAPGRKMPPVIEGVAERPDGGASVLPAGYAPAAPDKPKRKNRWRLRILLAINALLAAIYPFFAWSTSRAVVSSTRKCAPSGSVSRA
jgi:hypothetical protein